MKNLFTSETYVKSEFRYHKIARKGSFDEDQVQENWTVYLEENREFIEQGFQFTRLAVQEPYGVMILGVSFTIHYRPEKIRTNTC